jgi:hypothetical protein
VRKFKKTKTNKEKQSNEKLEDTKAGIRSQKSKTERQYNDKKKNVQRTDNNKLSHSHLCMAILNVVSLAC